jgi:multiple sugar transport system substrate-binding protein
MMDTISFWLVAFNEKHLAEANLTLPEMGWTWDDFREYAKKLTTPKRSGAFFYTWSEYANPVLYTERKNPHIKADLSPQFDDPSFKNYFGLRRAMEKEDKSTKPYSTVIGANLHFTTEFFNEEASMMMYNTRVIDYANDTKKFPHDFKTAFAPLPRSSKDAEIGNTNMGGEFYSIGAKSKYKKETYDLIRWLTTEGTKLGVSGLPGWKKADGKAAVDTIIGSNKEQFNVDSLITTLYDKRVKTSVDTDLAVPYQAELRKVLEEGFKKYMLDNTSVEEAQKYMMDEANKVSQRNK